MNQNLLRILAAIFFLSGFSALIYQVVWQRYLTLYYGVGSVSITLIVSIYMAGLGFGALAGGHLAERVKHKLLFYFIVELGIGVFGLLSLPLLDLLGKATAGVSYAWSAVFMFLFLCIPTFLMGVTLPLLTKIYNSITRNFLNTVSLLYFINTLGAAFGALVTAYVLISFFGLHTGIGVAVFINFILALMIYTLRNKPVESSASYQPTQAGGTQLQLGKMAFALVFITGFLAIGYEVVWIRMLTVLLKSSAYVFATVLAVYLAGIAIGSFTMGRYIQRNPDRDRPSLFFQLQFMLAASVALLFVGYYYLTGSTGFGMLSKLSFTFSLHPDITRYPASAYPPDIGKLITDMPALIDAYHLFDILFWPLFFVFIPTLFMGATFPLIASLALTDPHKEGETVGKIYFFNVLGNIIGGLVTGFVLLKLLGTELTLLLFILTGLLLGLFAKKPAGKPIFLNPYFAGIAFSGLLVISLFPGKGDYYALLHPPANPGVEYHFEEGIEGVVTTYKYQEQVRNYINGLEHGGRPGYNFYYETLEAARFAPSMNDILVIGYGTGSIVEAVLNLPQTRSVTIVELNPTLIRNLRKMALFDDMLNDDRVSIIFDDARRYLHKSDNRFDLILTDPLRSTTAYSNNLYSRQFFSLANAHLKPGGIFMVWMDEHNIMPKTVAAAFEHTRIYDYFSLGSNQPFIPALASVSPMLMNFNQSARQGILDYEKNTAFLGGNDYINSRTADYPVNQDWAPWLEYYIGVRSMH